MRPTTAAWLRAAAPATADTETAAHSAIAIDKFSLLTNLVDVFAEALSAEQVEALLRQTGKALAKELASGKRLSGSLRSRATTASGMLNDHLGATTHVEHNGEIVIRGAGCPLAALTGKHRGVCLAMESLVAEIVGTPVHECCNRSDRPRCCFEIASESVRQSA